MSDDQVKGDQEDLYQRILADRYFDDIATILQRKGIVEDDIIFALSTLNERNRKMGVCVVVLMPTLVPENPNSPGPEYEVQPTIQVIEQPLFNLGSDGTGKSAEEVANRLRRIIHHFSNGGGRIFTFAGMEPIAVDAGKISYGVKFRSRSADFPIQKTAAPTIQATSSAVPATIQLTCATAAADIWFTTDGSYPASGNAAAIKYTGAFDCSGACTVRAGAEADDLAPSNITQLVLTDS